LETKMTTPHQTMVQMWDKSLAVASLTETINEKRVEKQTEQLLFYFSYFSMVLRYFIVLY
jgi:hypothetical protein